MNWRKIDPPRLKRDFYGKTVRLLTDIRNGLMSAPAGTIMTVNDYSRGAELKGNECKECGITPYFKGVPPSYFEFVEKIEENS